MVIESILLERLHRVHEQTSSIRINLLSESVQHTLHSHHSLPVDPTVTMHLNSTSNENRFQVKDRNRAVYTDRFSSTFLYS